MKKNICLLISILLTICSLAQNRFPGKSWEKLNPEEYGYSIDKLNRVETYAKDSISTAAFMIIQDGGIIYEWGETKEKYLTHSCRKSFMSAVYGKYIADGTIDLNATMAELNIDDNPPLSDQEKEATIRQCLMARSGVFHTALAESEGMHALKPARGTYKAGEYWMYNNWDFNVLLTIFEQETKKDFFQTLKDEIADPIQMSDFLLEDYIRRSGERSIHDSYMFWITASDMARFGLLFLRNGKWKDKQLIPQEWVKESTSYYSDATIYGSDGYGYMWWVAKNGNTLPHFENVTVPEGTYSARGYNGHYIVVIPEYDMVVVHRVDTWPGEDKVSGAEFGRLLSLILESKKTTELP